MAKAKNFVEEGTAKVRKYSTSGYNGKPGVLFTLGRRIRLRYVEMIGIVKGEVTELTDPAGVPYLILADKKQGKSECRFFATNGIDYYDLDRLDPHRCAPGTYHDPGGTGEYRAMTREKDAFSEDGFWKTVDRRRARLTTHYQDLAKQVLNEYFNHAFNAEDE
jgi:hypothetical protein